MRWPRKRQTIMLYEVRLRLAAELAMRKAIDEELRHQVAEQLGCPPACVHIALVDSDFRWTRLPDVNIAGMEVEWR